MLIVATAQVYWVAAVSLYLLQPDLIMEETRLAQTASSRAEALYYSEHLDFYESVRSVRLLL